MSEIEGYDENKKKIAVGVEAPQGESQGAFKASMYKKDGANWVPFTGISAAGTSKWNRDIVNGYIYPKTTTDIVKLDNLEEYTAGAGVSVNCKLDITGGNLYLNGDDILDVGTTKSVNLYSDTIQEFTLDAGVSIEDLKVKGTYISGTGSPPCFTSASGNDAYVGIIPADGDGTDNAELTIFGVTGAASERLGIGWSAGSGKYIIDVRSDGPNRALGLSTPGGASLELDGTITANGVVFDNDLMHCKYIDMPVSKVFHVDCNRIDGYTEDGSINKPYRAIQSAITASSAGDTIKIADGTYIITSGILVDKGVFIVGNITHPGNVVIKYSPASGTLNCIEVNSADTNIQGVKVQDCKNGFHFDRNISTNTGVTISNCIVKDVSGWGIAEISSPNTVISYNTITNTGDKGIYIRKCAGTSGSNKCEAIGNVISGCGQAAIQVYQSPYAIVSENTISSTNDKGIFVWGSNASSTAERVELTNNTVSGCPWGAILVIHDRYTYIHGNDIGPTGDKGITVGNGEHVTSIEERIEISGNTVTGTKYPGIQTAWDIPYTYIYDNKVTGCNYYGADGTGDWDYASIHIDTNCPNTIIDSNDVSDGVNGIQTWSNDCEITNNKVHDMGLTYADTKITGDGTYYNSGIIVGSNWLSGNLKPTGTVVKENTLCDNIYGIYVRDYATLSPLDPVALNLASLNCWFGDTTGPDDDAGVINGSGDKIAKTVTAEPFENKGNRATDARNDSSVTGNTVKDALETLDATKYSESNEIKIKVYSQNTEPTLSEDHKLAMWIDTDDASKTYLLFRRGSGDQLAVELT